jgi:hypothetical protein
MSSPYQSREKGTRRLQPEEAAEALEVLRPIRMYVPALLLGITCGLRRGKTCALRSRSIDLGEARAQLDCDHQGNLQFCHAEHAAGRRGPR